MDTAASSSHLCLTPAGEPSRHICWDRASMGWAQDHAGLVWVWSASLPLGHAGWSRALCQPQIHPSPCLRWMQHQTRIPGPDPSTSRDKTGTGRDREARALHEPLSQPSAVPPPQPSRGPTISRGRGQPDAPGSAEASQGAGHADPRPSPSDTLSLWVPRPHQASHGLARAHQGPRLPPPP